MSEQVRFRNAQTGETFNVAADGERRWIPSGAYELEVDAANKIVAGETALERAEVVLCRMRERAREFAGQVGGCQCETSWHSQEIDAWVDELSTALRADSGEGGTHE